MLFLVSIEAPGDWKPKISEGKICVLFGTCLPVMDDCRLIGAFDFLRLILHKYLYIYIIDLTMYKL